MLTIEQIKVLSKYEKHLETAVRAGYARMTNPNDLRIIADIYIAATGSRERFTFSCATCNFRLLQDVGKIYFASKEAMEKKKVTKKRKA